MRLGTIAAGVALTAATVAGCGGGEEPDAEAFLQTVRSGATVPDKALLGYAEDLCAEVSDPFTYMDAAVRNYPGVSSKSALVDAAILNYCPEVGEKVLDENGDFKMG